MADPDFRPESGRSSLVERGVHRIASARSVTLGLAAAFVVLAFIGAVVIRLADAENFPSFGLAVWWALQTITTVGYGDVVPTTRLGQVVGGLEMVIGISLIAFLIAGVTSKVIQRGEASREEVNRAQREREVQTIVDALAQTRHAISDLDTRLERIELRLGRGV